MILSDESDARKYGYTRSASPAEIVPADLPVTRHTRAQEKLNIPQNFITPFPYICTSPETYVSFTSSTSASRHFLSPPLARKQERRINCFIGTKMRTQLYIQLHSSPSKIRAKNMNVKLHLVSALLGLTLLILFYSF